jgi:iron(III) transport system ATP-binding protein
VDDLQSSVLPLANSYTMSQSLILRLENITKQFANAQTPAVQKLSLTLHQGEILALLGPSGCGKTTLLRMIAGFESPQSGQIFLGESLVAMDGFCLPPERRDVGMVFQDYALFPHLTVRQNIAFGLKHRRLHPESKMRQTHIIREALERVGLSGLENRYPHQLSGGQQQRVALARALAPCPALILLDEPLSNLDVQVRLRLRQEIRYILKQAGLSAIFVTHDQEEALGIADQVVVMQQGQIEQIGTPEDIYAAPRTRFVAEFVTQANFLPARAQAGEWATEIGIFKFSLDSYPADLYSREKWSQSAVLMIRPEEIRLYPEPYSAVIVCDRQFLGREYRYSLRLPSGQILYALTSTDTAISVGTYVMVDVSDAHMQLY